MTEPTSDQDNDLLLTVRWQFLSQNARFIPTAPSSLSCDLVHIFMTIINLFEIRSDPKSSLQIYAIQRHPMVQNHLDINRFSRQ